MDVGPEIYSDDEGVVLKRRSVKLTLIDSDDEDHGVGIPSGKTTFGDRDSSSEDNSEKENSSLKANRKSKRRVVTRDSDSDSDGESLENFKPKTVDPGEPPKKPSLLFMDKDLYDDETSDQETPVTFSHKYTLCKEAPAKFTRNEDLYDAEGSDDGEFKPDGDTAEEIKTAKKPAKKLESRKAKTAAMAGIELIHSETQRLLRESRLSLPYHRPKQHTITEFLQRRSVQATKEHNTNSQDLSLIWKELEERTKEAEAFYKSDSEDSDAEGEKQPSSQDTIGDAGASASDALKDSGILSMTNSFSSEASPVDSDTTPLPLEAQGTCLKFEGSTGVCPDSEGLLLDNGDNSLAARHSEMPGVIENIQTLTNCEEDTFLATVGLNDVNKAEAQIDPPESCQKQVDPISPELVSRRLEETNVQETSPDLFLSQQVRHTVCVEDQTAVPNTDELSNDTVVVVPETSKATPRSAAALLISKLGDIKPRLSCGQGDIVDLTSDSTPKRGVEELISRFMKQSGSKPSTPKENSKVGVSVVSVEKDLDGLEQVKSDTVFVTLDEGVVVDPALAKPGAKLQRLKEELNKKIAKQREEEWTKKQLEYKIDEEIDDEKSECGLLDDDREAEMSESETEEEEEEDDVPIVEKKRTKSAFLDDEAEVSEDEEAVSGEEDEEENDDEVKSEAQGADDVEDTDEDEETLQPEDTNKRSKLRRIKTFDMFETDEEKSEDDGEEDVGNVSTVSTLNIPPYQPGGALTQPPKEEPGSITPLLKVPVLKGVLSEPNLNECSLMSPCELTQPIEHITDVDVNQAKKKLFNQSEFSTQENMAELMDVCSGTFSGKVASELMGLCSGNFLTQPVNIESLEKDDENVPVPSYELEDTQQIASTGGKMVSDLTGLISGNFPTQTTNYDKSASCLEGSQGLEDTQSLKRFYSEDSNAQFPDKTPDRSPKLRLTLISSDEEADDEIKPQKKKQKRNKKKNLKLYFSDEEDIETTDRMIGYDSEENEIDLEEEKQRMKAKATEFFEDEAELSESEWGSEDEDEKDLDKLEWEEGDAEKLNEKKVREQLEKIHMRRVLDDDQREVRILQELLLEDGEFHTDGPGRERKFRWKNINIVQMDQAPQDSDDENAEGDDEEDEAEWRKRRFERETFLMEQKEKAAAAGTDFDDDLGADEDSQLLQLGKAALKRMRSFNSEQGAAAGGRKAKGAASDPQVSPNPKYPFKLLTKRGSFLARSEVALARIAHITRGTGTTNVNGPKHSRNFVFTTVSPEKVSEPAREEQPGRVKPTLASSKRKSSNMPSVPFLKKPRLTTGKGLFDHLEL